MKIAVVYNSETGAIITAATSSGNIAPEFEEGDDVLDVPNPEIWAETFKEEESLGGAVLSSCRVNEAADNIELI